MSGTISALVLPGDRLGLTFPAGVYNRAGTVVLLPWNIYWVLPCYPSVNDAGPKWLLVGQGWCRRLLFFLLTLNLAYGWISGQVWVNVNIKKGSWRHWISFFAHGKKSVRMVKIVVRMKATATARSYALVAGLLLRV